MAQNPADLRAQAQRLSSQDFPMPVSMRRQWQHFVATPQGRRFQTRHRLRRARRNGLLHRCMITGLGVLLILAGTIMLVFPGPGILALVIGAALIAEESLLVARLLDRADVWIAERIESWRAKRQESG